MIEFKVFVPTKFADKALVQLLMQPFALCGHIKFTGTVEAELEIELAAGCEMTACDISQYLTAYHVPAKVTGPFHYDETT